MELVIEQDELRDSARRVLGDQPAQPVSSGHGAGGFDRDQWKLIAELGWLGLTVPEELGGLGQPFYVLATLHQEFGRVLSAQPFLTASRGLDALARCGGTSAGSAALLEQALAGEAIIVISSGKGSVTAAVNRESVTLTGTVRTVLDAGSATHLLVSIDCGEPAIALVTLPHPAVNIISRPAWDQTRQVFDVQFEGATIDRNQILVRGDTSIVVMNHAGAQFDLALASDAIGGAGAILDETLAYMAIRQQFNRFIASFQALKHRCADHKTSIEAARSLVEGSCRSYSDDQGEWRAMAASARLLAGSVYRTVTEDAVQLHGGIGFTWEQNCHLFLKRARLSEILGGSPEQRMDEIAPVLVRAAVARTGSLLTQRVS